MMPRLLNMISHCSWLKLRNSHYSLFTQYLNRSLITAIEILSNL